MRKETAATPYLFRFKVECVSPNRVPHDDGFYYDQERCQVVTVLNGKVVPAIEAETATGPKTKKADIEKGEDQKDRHMWR